MPERPSEDRKRTIRVQFDLTHEMVEDMDSLKPFMGAYTRSEAVRRSIQAIKALIKLHDTNKELTLSQVLPTILPNLDTVKKNTESN